MNLHRIYLALLLPLAANAANSSSTHSTLKMAYTLEEAYFQETDRYATLEKIAFDEPQGMFTKVDLVGKRGFVITTCDLAARRCKCINEKGEIFVDSMRVRAALKELPHPIVMVPGKPVQVSGTLYHADYGGRMRGEAELYSIKPSQHLIWAREPSDSGETRWISGIFLEPDTSVEKLFGESMGKAVTISGVFRTVRLTPTRQFLLLDNPQLVPEPAGHRMQKPRFDKSRQ